MLRWSYCCSYLKLIQNIPPNEVLASTAPGICYGGHIVPAFSSLQVQHPPVHNSNTTSLTLENLPMDIWMHYIAPLLSAQDIIRMGAVSKRLQLVFDHPYLFKKLCMDRFKISPGLDDSYYDVFKIMSAAKLVADLDSKTVGYLRGLFWNDWKHIGWEMFGDRTQSTIRTDILYSYPLIIGASATAECSHNCRSNTFLMPPGRSDDCSISRAKNLFPELSTKTIKKECKSQFDNLHRRRYSIGDLIDLAVRKHESIAAYQSKEIERLKDHFLSILPLLPYALRKPRFHAVTINLHHLYSSRKLLPSQMEIIMKNVQDINATQRWVTGTWFSVVQGICRGHTALGLYIKDRLQFRVADYFDACTLFESMHMPRCSCPRITMLLETVYGSLGPVLQGRSHKEDLDKDGILQALIGCARREALELQPVLDLTTHSSCSSTPERREVLEFFDSLIQTDSA